MVPLESAFPGVKRWYTFSGLGRSMGLEAFVANLNAELEAQRMTTFSDDTAETQGEIGIRQWVRSFFEVLHHEDSSIRAMLPWSPCGTKIGVHNDIADTLGNGIRFRATELISFKKQMKTVGFVRTTAELSPKVPDVKAWFTLKGLSQSMTLAEFAGAVEEATLRARQSENVSLLTRAQVDFDYLETAFSSTSFNDCVSSASWLSGRKALWRKQRQDRQDLKAEEEIISAGLPSPSVEYAAARQRVSSFNHFNIITFCFLFLCHFMLRIDLFSCLCSFFLRSSVLPATFEC
jgi:hypothetical protein